jgi:transcriptional regulator
MHAESGGSRPKGYDLYAGADDGAALRLLTEGEHGHLAVWDAAARQPALTFMHYVPRPAERELWGHLANANPMLAALERDPRATFTVFGPAAYVASYFGGEPRGVPTSYYSWAQCEVEVALLREPAPLLEILAAMLARFQPEGRHPPLDPTERYWQGMLGAITGVKLRIRGVASRFKYGQNKSAHVRGEIVRHLRERAGGQDAAVVAQVLAHLLPESNGDGTARSEPSAPPTPAGVT